MAALRNKPFANPTENALLQVLRSAVNEDLPADASVTVGFSGGRDSVVLLDALSHLLPSPRLSAIHVHHGISKHADQWATFCVQFAQQRGISCEIHRVAVCGTGEGLEAAARKARFSAFTKSAFPIIALAHHQNDQAETVLFRLLRGTGVQGLAGMPKLRPNGAGGHTLWRPLLNLPRQVLEDYAEINRLNWIEDDSNIDQSYTRNYLRHTVFPLVHKRFPAASQALGRMADHAEEAAALLEERAAEDLEMCTVGEIRGEALALEKLVGLSAIRQRNLLRFWLKEKGWQAPETRTLAEWQSQLETATEHSLLVLSYGPGECRSWRGLLYRVERETNETNVFVPILLTHPMLSLTTQIPFGSGVLRWCFTQAAEHDCIVGYRVTLDASKLALVFASEDTLQIAHRSGGEKLQLAPNRPRRLLKKLLQESEIPPWQRGAVPLIYWGETLVACFGIGVAPEFQAKSGAESLTFIWHPSRQHLIQDL